MKTKFIQTIGAVCLFTSCLFTSLDTSAQTNAVAPPTIITQPADQTADYGNNVAFNVTANGEQLQYQWQKNGIDLADYHNVSGAKADTLILVGVAQTDVANYTVVVSNPGGSVTSSVVTIVINSTTVFS